jgi:Do/DeqQ family serine protease
MNVSGIVVTTRRLTKNVSLLPAAVLIGMLAGPARAADPPKTPGGHSSLAPLLERTTPAVVNISVITRKAESENPPRDDPFSRPEAPESGSPLPRQGIGSGVIVDADAGLIISNYHVVAEAEEIVVTLSNQRRYEAELVGGDAGTDIALLRVNAEDLTALSFGDSEQLRVGDYVVAIGNPFGLGQTATTGIVSALGRSGINAEGYEDFIQTDASINPGNSGGALIDLDGRLMGINTAIVSPAGGNVGIGFAVPGNMAKVVVDQLLEFGEVSRGQLGIIIQDVTPDLAEALSLETTRGAIITNIQPGSTAELADLRVGDVVIELNGNAIASSTDVRNQVGVVRAGEEVTVTVSRDGERQRVTARLGDLPSQEIALLEPRQPQLELDELGGATLSDIPPNYPGHGTVTGVFVSDVVPGSESALQGLRPLDVIVAVNRTAVDSMASLSNTLQAVAGPVALDVLREGRHLFVVFQTDEG